MKKLTDFEKAEIKAFKEAAKGVKIFDGQWRKPQGLEADCFLLGFHEGFKAATEAQEAEVARLKAKVNRLVESLDTEGVYQAEDRSDYLADREEVEPTYQQKPVQEWREGGREE